MPHIRFRGLTQPQVAELSQQLLTPLAQACECPEDYFSFEWLHSVFYQHGEMVGGTPTAEVHWFERGQETRINVDRILREAMRQHTNNRDLLVLFYPLDPESYYENGQHYG